MEQLGAYYDCTFMAARPARPRDKASVERHVQIAYQHIFAPLRNEVFWSLSALNEGIADQLRLLCDRPMQGRGGDTRRSRFERDERPCLRPLPGTPFELRYTVPAKVQKNYHVLLGRDHHFYSVPYQYIGQQASIVHTSKNVEIYIGNQCVAAHSRARGHGYSTTKSHLPPHHRHFAEQRAMTGEDYLRQARDIGPNCEATVQSILKTKTFHEQAFNSCTGIIRLAAKFTPQRLENACARANKAKAATYTIVRNILRNNLDMAVQAEEGTRDIPRHHNIRGPMAYA
jgi:transposase